MSESEQDEFEEYLKRRVLIDKRTSSLEHLDPPPELDRIVISKARKAIRSSPIHFFHAPKWALPVGLAAIILVSFAIMLDLGVRESRREMGMQAAPTEVMAAANDPISRAPAPAPVPPVATTPWPPTADAPSASSSATLRADTTEEAGNDKARTRLARAQVAAKRLRADTNAESALTDEAAKRRLASLKSAASQSVVTTTSAGAAKPTEFGVDLSPVLASMASSARAAIEGIPDPASRLEQIEKLRRDGHVTRAEREMERFRETYPDYPIPAGSSR